MIDKEIGGKKAEPVEVLTVDVPAELAGTVIVYAVQPREDMVHMQPGEGRTRTEFFNPSSGLIGFRSRMLQATGGEIVMHHRFYEYEDVKGSIPEPQTGSIVSMANGPANACALEYIGSDELAEVTPANMRIRKAILDETARKLAAKRRRSATADVRPD